MLSNLKKLLLVILYAAPYMVAIWLWTSKYNNLAVILLILNFGVLYTIALLVHIYSKHGS